MSFDVHQVREDFPILSRTMANGRPLVYLDSANTSQKPTDVLDAMTSHLSRHNANVARAVHQLGAEATEAFENARRTVASFIGAARPEEIIFTKNASEALNLVARVLGDPSPFQVSQDNNVVITQMEHHSNLVPWQQLCQRTGAELAWFDVDDHGRLVIDPETVSDDTAVVSATWVSNTLGTINPIKQLADLAHSHDALFVVDGSQAVPQMPVNVSESGADLMAFTGHKLCGPTGIGVLWGRYELLEQLPPFLGGGEMIEQVTMEKSTYAPPPHRFEAGTPPIVEAVGLAAACDYLSALDMNAVRSHEVHITGYALEKLSSVNGLSIMGPTDTTDRGGAIAFQLDDVHPHDIAQVLDAHGIAVRAGHHCTKPLHQRFNVQSSIRVSPYIYTTTDEIDALIDGLDQVRAFFS